MSNLSDEEFLNELIKRSEDFADQECRKYAVKELEKLRAELHETAEMHIDGDYYLRDEWIDEYINNHIKELKGE